MLHSKRKEKKRERKRTKVQSAYRTTRIQRGSPIVSLSLLLLFCVEEVVKALALPPSSLGGDEASFISTHMRCVITFLFLRFFVLVDYFLDEFN